MPVPPAHCDYCDNPAEYYVAGLCEWLCIDHMDEQLEIDNGERDNA